MISTLPITINPQSFNDLIPQTSGLIKLRDKQLVATSSTRPDIDQRIEKLELLIKEPIPKLTDLFREKQMFVTKMNSRFQSFCL